MERIGLRELRQNASRYIARVAGGESIEVTQRGRLVARIVPARPETWADLILRGDVIPADSPGGLLDVVPLECDIDVSAELQRLRTEDR